MHADHQQEFGLLGWHQRDDKAVSRSMRAMCAGRGPGLYQGTGVPQGSVDLRPRALSRGLRHSRDHFASSRLIAAPIQFQVCTRHVEWRNEPAIS